ncbi:MAG: phage holin family protein [Patescibacteria group bacterium]|jgi:putative membrane protein
MINNVVKFLINGFAVYMTGYLLSGVKIASYWVALVVSVVLAVLNVLVKPLLILLSLPINILTLGLFTFVIDALIVLLASNIVPGFEINSFWTAMLFSIVLTVVSFVLHKLIV